MSELCLEEKFFTAIAWTPKATVQAAIGGLALDEARTPEEERPDPPWIAEKHSRALCRALRVTLSYKYM